MRLRTKLAALAVTAGVALSATAAYAYWTTTGSGSGSATAAAGNSDAGGTGVTVAQEGTTSGLVPGGTPQAVNVTVTNHNPGSVKVGTVSAAITPGWTKSAVGHPDCTAADFDIQGASTAAGVLATNATSASLTGITIRLKDGSLDQDACKSASPTLVFTAAAGS